MWELTLQAPRALVEALSDALVETWGALSVSVEDADAGAADEEPLFGEPGLPAPAAGWQRSTLRALFADAAAADTATAALSASSHAGAGVAVQASGAVPEQDWVRLTQSQFTPVEITPDFWVVPSWHAAPPAARRVIRLDPGLAFGTGTHPTTRMCLRWLARQPADSLQRVLDYGCGSGILAIGAARCGARDIDAVDIDVAAVQATRDNAAGNGVVLQTGPPEQAQGEYAVVVANILARPLEMLAPLLCGHVAPGGRLVLAGLLERQAQGLIGTYAPWLQLCVADAEDGWALLAGARAGAA